MTRVRSALCAMMALIAGSAPAFAGQRSYVYVNNNTSPNQVSAFEVDTTGRLTVIPGAPFDTGGSSVSTCAFAAERAAVFATRKFLFVSNTPAVGVPSVSVFAIDAATGALTLVGGSPFALPAAGATCPTALATSIGGRFLAVATSLFIHMLAIDAETGALAPVPGSPFFSGINAVSLGMSHDGGFLTVAGTSLRTFAISDTGELTVIGNFFGGVNTSAEYSCDGSRLVAGRTTGVSLFSVGPTGALTFLAGSPGSVNTQSVTLNLGDTVVFGNATAQVYSFGISGDTVAPVDAEANPEGNGPVPLTVSGDGRFLFVPGSGTLNVFGIGPGGDLTLTDSTTTATMRGAVAAYPGKTCDTQPPVTTLRASPAPNAAGWNSTDVELTLTATDGEIGSGVKEIRYTLSGAHTGSAIVAGDTATIRLSQEGETTISYFAVDYAGNEEAVQTYTVRIDKTAPVATCSVDTPTLWSPNHKLVPVTVTLNVNDAAAGPGTFALVSATSNEADNGLGDGDTADDIQGVTIGSPATTVLLRAERAATGTGRIYTLTYSAADLAGNTTTCSATVTVPHSQK